MKGFRVNVILVYVLVSVFLFQSVSFTYGNDTLTTEQKAEVLYELGLFAGISTTEFVPNLEGDANREQAMKIIAVALNWAIDATSESGFVDVSDWANSYVATAVNKGITNGVGKDSNGNDLFGAQSEVTARQLESWFDRVIHGSKTAWEDNASLDNSKGITRGYLVEVTYSILSQTPDGATISLIESMVGDDESLLEIASKGGLIDASSLSSDSDEPTINSVIIGEDKKLYVDFSEVVDSESATEEDYYILYDDEDDEIKNAISLVLLSDTDTVIIKYNSYLSGEYTLAIEGVKDLAGNVMNDELTFDTYKDDGDAGPIIEEIDIENSKEILIIFSDDLDEESAEDIDNYALYDRNDNFMRNAVESATLSDDEEVTIMFKYTLSGEYMILVRDIEDEDGNEADDRLYFNTDGDDETAPTIEDIDVNDSNDITVIFSEDVDNISAESELNYTLYDANNNVIAGIKDIKLTADDEVTVYFNSSLYGDYTIDIDGVEDLAGNEMNDEEDFEVNEDGPTISSISVEDYYEITINFSEDLDKTSAQKEENYALYQDGEEIVNTVESAVLSDDEDVTVTFDDNLNGIYTIKAIGVEDEVGNESNTEKEFTVTDDDEPTIEDVEVEDDDEIVITFSEDIDSSSASDESNFRLFDSDGHKIYDVVKSTKLTGSKEVTVKFSYDLESGDYTILVEGLEDEAGNQSDDEEDFDI